MNISPLPWTTVGNGIIDANGAFVLLVSCGDTMCENLDLAAKIKNAVNCHAELVAALHQYARHKTDCAFFGSFEPGGDEPGECNCGLESLICKYAK